MIYWAHSERILSPEDLSSEFLKKHLATFVEEIIGLGYISYGRIDSRILFSQIAECGNPQRSKVSSTTVFRGKFKNQYKLT